MRESFHRSLFGTCLLLLLSGCATLPNGRGWGQDATIKPGWDRIRESAVQAVKSPYTWAPLAGAAFLQINDWDEDITKWAADETPIFGSNEDAEDASDTLRDLSRASAFLTMLATPSGVESKEWMVAKAKGLAVMLAAYGMTGITTDALKDLTDRTRPDGSDNKSFPSGHASGATVSATLAVRNLRYIDIGDRSKQTLQFGVGALAVGTAWARVEANVHHVSDVLVGAALGHFFSAFIYDAFMGLGNSENTDVSVEWHRDMKGLRFYVAF